MQVDILMVPSLQKLKKM